MGAHNLGRVRDTVPVWCWKIELALQNLFEKFFLVFSSTEKKEKINFKNSYCTAIVCRVTEKTTIVNGLIKFNSGLKKKIIM